ncbi:sugar transferase [Oscillatoria sp. CS-180]|nr:Npun_R2821/Npun_R2822 family protein [Oscillatoria sp. CS-180]MDB9526886.1 sugar transferase [Oscillatoria sp. CS-180]
MDGICTLGNDNVYDQIVALLNSIEVHAGKSFPVCIYPYDDRLDKLRQLAASRPHLHLFEEKAIIERWDQWVHQIWSHHPTAAEKWLAINGKSGIHRMGTHRRFCAFEGPFDRFIYMDADTLLLSSPETIFKALDYVDWVTYDFQYKNLSHVFDLSSPKLKSLFSEKALEMKTFCSGFYGAKLGAVAQDDIEWYLQRLAQGEAEVLYPMAPDQTILNYFVLRRPIESANLAIALSREERTGNSVTSTHFEERDNVVFDGDLRLLYLHYIGISSKLIARLCEGENLDIPYRNTFLHYRYLHAPQQRPSFEGPLVSTEPTKPSLGRRILRKLSS